MNTSSIQNARTRGKVTLSTAPVRAPVQYPAALANILATRADVLSSASAILARRRQDRAAAVLARELETLTAALHLLATLPDLSEREGAIACEYLAGIFTCEPRSERQGAA